MMNRSVGSSLLHGAVGGVMAGGVVALWFLAVDVIAAEPFRTPSLLASEILGEPTAVPSARLVVAYTVLHFGVFAALGATAAALLAVTRVAPTLLAGGVFGLVILNGAHYGGLLVTGVDLLTVLPVVHVLGANLLGGMVLMAYLHRAWRADTPLGIGALIRRPVMVEGVTIGLLGALAVAAWFFVIDLASGAPLFTPAALGSALFLGAATPASVQHSLGIALAYTVVHVVAFGVVGILFAWVAGRLERSPAFWLLTVMAFIVLEGLFVGATGVLAGWVLGALGWWAIFVGNALAVATMGWWTWNTHPRLRQAVGERMAETRV
jgi:hypothetical protein